MGSDPFTVRGSGAELEVKVNDLGVHVHLNDCRFMLTYSQARQLTEYLRQNTPATAP